MEEMLERIKALLQDRFKLAVHTEMRDAPHYALKMARSDRRPGPLLRPDPTNCAALPPGDARCAATRAGGALRMSGATLRDVAFSLSCVSLFTALREQLGLALDSRTGPIEFLVIDSAQRPIED